MNLRKRILILFAATSVILFLTDKRFNFRIADFKSTELSIVPFGYHYKNKPFTGLIYNKNQTGFIDRIIFIYNGLRHGPEILWYENGQRWIERNYSFGREDGFQKAWHPDGRPLFFKFFNNGLANGEFYEWFPDGGISSFIKYENGVEKTAKTWTGSGKPFYNYSWRNNERIGLLGDRYCTKLK